MRFLRQSMLGVLLASVALALLLFAGQMVASALQDRMAKQSRAPQARERVFTVTVQTAEPQTITPTLQAFGQIESRRTLELRAPSGGRIIGLTDAFVEGGGVTAGETLVHIDPADAQAGFDRANSDHLDAQAEVRDAKRSLEFAQAELRAAEDQATLRETAFQRQKDLETRGVGTTAAVETAELSAAQARQSVLSRRISVAQAEARVDQAATRLVRAGIALADAKRGLADTTITARFDGALSDVAVVEGRLVSPNEKLALLIDPSALEVAFRVSTAQYIRLLDELTGTLLTAPVQVSLDVSGVEIAARGQIIRDAAATADGQSGRLIFARLEDTRGFKPGDFVTVAVQEPPLRQVIRLPAASVDAKGSVLVLGEGDRLEEHPAEVLRRQGDDILLQAGDLAGRDIVTARTPLLGAGIQVRPLRNTQSAPEAPEMVELDAARRAELIAFIEGRSQIPQEAKDRILAKLSAPKVSVQLIERIETRMGG